MKLSDINFFGITNEQFFNKNFIKVICGVAGSAKSTNCEKVFSDFGIKYTRLTSTNRLKEDAEKRFGGDCKTVASGLYKNENGDFYIEEKDISYQNIVIDEILQTNLKVLDFCRNHVGKVNIIICTDDKQMLVPLIGEKFLKEFKDFKKEPFVINIELKKTYRAINTETGKLFYDLYDAVDKGPNQFKKRSNGFYHIDFEDIEFNNSDIFITHTNEIEKILYNRFQLFSDRSGDYVKKGTIASKASVDESKYPILCQSMVKTNRMGGYLQLSNVATATRFQGSEVLPSQKLYFIVERKSVISNREFYTVISRCKDIKSFVIVYIDIKEEEKMSHFYGKPIKEAEVATVDENIILSSGKTLKEEIKEKKGRKLLLDEKDIDIIKSTVKDTETTKYADDFFFSCGVCICRGKGNEIEEELNKLGPTCYTLQSLLAKDSAFQLNYVDKVYKILEDHGVYELAYAHSHNASHKKKDELRYELDLYAAYPHLLCYADIPVRGQVYKEERKDKLNFYIYKGKTITKRSIITDHLKDYIESKEPGSCEFLFSTDYRQGSNTGDFLHMKAHKSVETKQELKKLHYGYMQKKYLEGKNVKIYGLTLKSKDSDYREVADYYVRNENNIYELIIVAICSELCYIMLTAQDIINEDSTIIVDAVHFNTEKAEMVIDKIQEIHELFPDYDFRVIDKLSDTIMYKTYETLKTRKELANESKRRYKERKKEEKLQKKGV